MVRRNSVILNWDTVSVSDNTVSDNTVSYSTVSYSTVSDDSSNITTFSRNVVAQLYSHSCDAQSKYFVYSNMLKILYKI